VDGSVSIGGAEIFIPRTMHVQKGSKTQAARGSCLPNVPIEGRKIHSHASWAHKVPTDRSEQVLAMSWYQVAPKRKEKVGKDAADLQRKTLTKAQLENFLSCFKTRECNNDGHHDPRICTQYHDIIKDRRRNPFEEYYTVDECVNKMEVMYHRVLIMVRRAHSK
jgi:hypothetical protein